MIVDRVLKIIQLHGDNKSQFYKKTGLSNGFLDKVKDIGTSKIEQILSAYPNINLEWLVTGRGDILKNQECVLKNFQTPAVITVNQDGNDNIVLVPQVIQAGYLAGGFSEPQYLQSLPSYRMPGLNNGVFRMFEVEGNSMYPTIPAKSYVVGQFIDNWINDIKDNQIYVIISNEVEDGFVKRVINRIEKYNNLICKSDNRRGYPTQNINPESIKEVWEVKLHLNFTLPDPKDLYDRMNDLEGELGEIKRILSAKLKNTQD